MQTIHNLSHLSCLVLPSTEEYRVLKLSIVLSVGEMELQAASIKLAWKLARQSRQPFQTVANEQEGEYVVPLSAETFSLTQLL